MMIFTYHRGKRDQRKYCHNEVSQMPLMNFKLVNSEQATLKFVKLPHPPVLNKYSAIMRLLE
jgi:hypothetical protein